VRFAIGSRREVLAKTKPVIGEQHNNKNNNKSIAFFQIVSVLPAECKDHTVIPI
jgi:hypothetical protein